jgi:hypothetical protein
MRVLTSAFLLTALHVLGCAAPEELDEEPIDLANSADDGKADSIAGKRLDPIITEEVTVEPGGDPYKGTIEVTTVGDRVIEVRGPRVVVPAGVDRTLFAAVESADSLDFFTALRFVALVRPAAGGNWTAIELKGTADPLFGDPYPITINYFEWIDMDPAGQSLSFEGRTGEATVPFKGLRGEDIEYSFFVFPESGWGSLAGTYNFELTTR